MLGSLINTISGNAAETPEVGMGVTFLYWSDRSAGTIIKVSESGKTITVQGDIATRIDKNGMSDSQKYEFSPSPNSPEVVYSLRKNGRWVRKGEEATGSSLVIGYRDAYYDYSF